MPPCRRLRDKLPTSYETGPNRASFWAHQSGGRTTRAEFDLAPATYAVVCFILDPATGQPHLANGIVTVFEVA